MSAEAQPDFTDIVSPHFDQASAHALARHRGRSVLENVRPVLQARLTPLLWHQSPLVMENTLSEIYEQEYEHVVEDALGHEPVVTQPENKDLTGEKDSVGQSVCTPISQKYKDTLELFSRGKSILDISAEHNITRKSAENRSDRLKRALGAKTLPHAVKIGFDTGLLSGDPVDPNVLLNVYKIGPRQKRVLELASLGMSLKEISDNLSYSYSTISKDSEIMQSVLRAKSLAHAVRIGIESNLLMIPKQP